MPQWTILLGGSWGKLNRRKVLPTRSRVFRRLAGGLPQAALERRAIPAVAIVHQKTWWPSIPSTAFDQLLGRPLRGRTWRHRYVQNFSVDVPDHEKDVQSLEQDCWNAKEVTSPYTRFIPSQELAPSRGWPSIKAAAHVLGDGPGRTSNPNLASSAWILF